jgi:chromosome segregation ATPase
MAGYKDYKSVTEFPLHTEKLERQELETAYQELRDSYRSLVLSRGQLVRRQTEAKGNLTIMNQKLMVLTSTLAKVQHEKQQLQQSLSHSVQLQQQLETWGNDLTQQVIDLSDQMEVTTKLLGEFEAVYEDVKEETGIFSAWNRLQRLIAAARRLLNADIKTLITKKQTVEKRDDWTSQSPANINRSLLDD